MVITVYYDHIAVRILLIYLLIFFTAFTPADFEQFVQSAVPLSIWIGIISLGIEICHSFIRFEAIDLVLYSFCYCDK